MMPWGNSGGRGAAVNAIRVATKRGNRAVRNAEASRLAAIQPGGWAVVWLLAWLLVLFPASLLQAQSFPPEIRGNRPLPRGGPFPQGRFHPLHLERLAGPPAYSVLTTEDAMRRGWVLAVPPRQPARMVPMEARPDQYWIVMPVDNGIVRLQRAADDGLWSLAAGAPAGPPRLEPTAREPRQLWRLVSYGQTVRLDSVAFPGRSLAGGADGLVTLERTSGAAAQRWLADFAPPPLPQPLPVIRLARHEVVPRPELPPVVVSLQNRHQNDLFVVVGDLRPGQAPTELSIPAGGAVQVRLARDGGATIRETYELHSPLGVLEQQSYVTEIPPVTLYDISVYERFLQSIAIDRTGKSPNVIEDVNYQPRSVGIFPVPAGAALPEQAQIDVWQQAQAAGNPGGVRPVASREETSERSDPLQQVLDEVKGGR